MLLIMKPNRIRLSFKKVSCLIPFPRNSKLEREGKADTDEDINQDPCSFRPKPIYLVLLNETLNEKKFICF